MEYINTESKFNDALKWLQDVDRIAFDTETTGKHPYLGDKLFCISAATNDEEFYFDFNIGEMPKRLALNFNKILNEPLQKHLFFVNAGFDIAIMRNDGIIINKGNKIVDAPVIARVEYNLHTGSKGSKYSEESFLSMDYLAKYYGQGEKDTTVEDYIKANNLYKIDLRGEKAPDYSAVPTEIMVEYACSDARITYDICMEIIGRLNMKEERYAKIRPKGFNTVMDLCSQEVELTPNVEAMQHAGMLVDVPYTEKAFKHELDLSKKLEKEVLAEVGKPLNLNSPKQKAKWVMNDLGILLPQKIDKKTKLWKGNYCTDAKTLEKVAEAHNLPVLNTLIASNKAKKKANTYYKNFLYLRDKNDIIHCGLGQENAITGRFSSFNPNLQNLTKETELKEFMVRKSFIARPNTDLYFLDFKQQEMKVMLDQAHEMSVINKMLSGEASDFYVAVMISLKESTGVEITRKQAKAIALGLAYGQGDALLAANLKCSLAQAKNFKRIFFSGLPHLLALKKNLELFVKQYGCIFNPYGRVTYIHKSHAYKALNAFVQGMSADITKRAINNVFKVCEEHKSRPLLTVHDEVIIEVAHGEEQLVPLMTESMDAAYPHNHLKIGVDVEKSKTSWAEKIMLTA